MAVDSRPQFKIEQEIGERVVAAADQLASFAPDLEASFPFELDDNEFTITIRRSPK
jgi:hypothetical protein